MHARLDRGAVVLGATREARDARKCPALVPPYHKFESISLQRRVCKLSGAERLPDASAAQEPRIAPAELIHRPTHIRGEDARASRQRASGAPPAEARL